MMTPRYFYQSNQDFKKSNSYIITKIGEFLPWVCIIAHNLVIDYFEK
jgi:DNA-directed RNA polymerase specialized sigma24 family protein